MTTKATAEPHIVPPPGENCANCAFYVTASKECHFDPAVCIAMGGGQLNRSMWPIVAANDWCGRYVKAGALAQYRARR